MPTHICTAIQAYAVTQLRFSSPRKHRSMNLCDSGRWAGRCRIWAGLSISEVGWRLSSNQKLGREDFWCQVSAGKSPRCSGSLKHDLTQPPDLHRLCPGKMAKLRSDHKTQQLPKLLLWMERVQQSCSPSSRGGKKSGRKLLVHPVYSSPSSRASVFSQ